jgi:signal transduction histidine kinase
MSERILKIRPYARLLTMLGEQLIKDEQIALSELIKNSYDADADWVKISFNDFEEKENSNELKILPTSKIIIEDNGSGMTIDVIEKSWMNPATPNKKSKDSNNIKTTPKGRIIQGEKGIGRFAILKLGRNIKITSRPKDMNKEFVINYDLSKYDDDFLSENGEDKELYIDDIGIKIEEKPPENFIQRSIVVGNKIFDQNDFGTKIEISNLKGLWNKDKINKVGNDIQKLESIFDKIFNKERGFGFQIGFELNSERLSFSEKIISELSNLLNNSSVLKITDGKYIEKGQSFSYKLNDIQYKLPLINSQISGLTVFKDYFLKDKDLFGNTTLRNSTCGDFSFNFFIFDFNADKETDYYLDKKEKELIKEHRIYLYRDKIRVAPYGDSDNDWLETDKKRATGRAGDYLSNDQIVGFVEISKKDNPRLKDKTNREGLIEEGYATRDFITLLHSFLLFIRQHPYKQYQERIKQINEQKTEKFKIVETKFQELKSQLLNNTSALKIYDEILKSYKIEQEFYKRRLENTEDLAAVGLSVETSSHDIMMMLTKGVDAIDNLVKNIEGGILKEELIEKELMSIRGIFSFVQMQMRDLQLLFKSSKQRRRDIRFSDLLEKVEKIYKRTLSRENIEYKVVKIGSPIIAKCTDAVILQLLINLFDNSIYWLSMPNVIKKQIIITLDGERKQVIFSDNGPGIRSDDEPYIFEAFYSGKEEGRGLGLYIARQLLNRMGYSIELAELKEDKILSGANFVINFIKNEEND